MKKQQEPMQFQDQKKKGLTTEVALILGGSGIIISIIIAGAIIFVSGEKVIQDVELDKSDNSNAQINEDSDMLGVETYQGTHLSFEYPDEYVLSTDEQGAVRITSTPIPDVDEDVCEQIKDRQAWAQCLDPTSGLSPNIIISFKEGDPEQLWSDIAKFDFNELDSLTLRNKMWRVYQVGGEFGGYVTYGYPTPDGLVIATFIHIDIGGGAQFETLESEIYKLSRQEQKVLLEQILATLEVDF